MDRWIYSGRFQCHRRQWARYRLCVWSRRQARCWNR